MALVNLKFSPEMEKAILKGRKCCTTRDERKGYPGDLFVVKDRVYRILQVDDIEFWLSSVMALAEGFESECEYEETMESIYPNIVRESIVYIHYFAYIGDYCPQFGIKGAVCSDPEHLCELYQDCMQVRI